VDYFRQGGGEKGGGGVVVRKKGGLEVRLGREAWNHRQGGTLADFKKEESHPSAVGKRRRRPLKTTKKAVACRPQKTHGEVRSQSKLLLGDKRTTSLVGGGKRKKKNKTETGRKGPTGQPKKVPKTCLPKQEKIRQGEGNESVSGEGRTLATASHLI